MGKEKNNTDISVHENYDMCSLYCNSGIDFLEESSISVNIEYKPVLWEQFPDSEIWDGRWVNAKYMNKNKKCSSKFNNIPCKHGGIFMWIVKPHNVLIPDYSFVAYIGNSEKNLKASIESFIKGNSNKYTGQVTTQELFEKCSLDLYVNYLECDDFKKTSELIEKLVEIVGPPIREILIPLQQEGEEAFA